MVDVLTRGNWIEDWSGVNATISTHTRDSSLADVWDGSKYTGLLYGNTILFACPEVSQTQIIYSAKAFSGSPSIRLYYGTGEYDFYYAGIDGNCDYVATSYTAGGSEVVTQSFVNYTVYSYLDIVVDISPALPIIGFMFDGWGGYPQGSPYEISAFALSNAVSSETPPFWTNYRAQIERIV